MKQINLGIIGAGYIANEHLKELKVYFQEFVYQQLLLL